MPLASGRGIQTADRGAVVIGSNVAQDWHLKVGSTVDLPKKPKDAPLSFVNHTFTVVGVLQPTLTAPDQFLWFYRPAPPMFLRADIPLAEPSDPMIRIELIPGRESSAVGRAPPPRPR